MTALYKIDDVIATIIHRAGNIGTFSLTRNLVLLQFYYVFYFKTKLFDEEIIQRPQYLTVDGLVDRFGDNSAFNAWEDGTVVDDIAPLFSNVLDRYSGVVSARAQNVLKRMTRGFPVEVGRVLSMKDMDTLVTQYPSGEFVKNGYKSLSAGITWHYVRPGDIVTYVRFDDSNPEAEPFVISTPCISGSEGYIVNKQTIDNLRKDDTVKLINILKKLTYQWT